MILRPAVTSAVLSLAVPTGGATIIRSAVASLTPGWAVSRISRTSPLAKRLATGSGGLALQACHRATIYTTGLAVTFSTDLAILRLLAGRALRWGVIVGCLLHPGVAHAHATWADGIPVPEWVTKACCGPSDAHHLRPDQIHRVQDGYRIDGYPKVIYDFQTLPSQDGEYWAFYGTTRDADGQPLYTTIFCFFAPSWG